MSEGDSFFDTSVLLYLLSSDSDKADQVEALLNGPGVISVQVLNEFVSVASRKFDMSLAEIREVLDTFRVVCRTEALTIEDHEHAVQIAERYKFSFYDSLIVASAIRAGCRTLYSEDLQHRQTIEHHLTVINPFVKG